jgi:hypothetical protein
MVGDNHNRMKNLFHVRTLYLIALSMLLFICCEDQEAATEAPVGLEGKWQIIKATRNDQDITSGMDFTKFRIHFESNNTYSIENVIPFLVKKEGTYSLDDPLYPVRMFLTENGRTESVAVDLNSPIVEGKRQISLKFSPGCSANRYEYVFEKTTE